MANEQTDFADAILSAIRRVVRAIDLDSKQMVRKYSVTGPQLVTLRAIARYGPISVTALARSINLSQPTVTGILFRLDQQGLIKRERDETDRRAVTSTITTQGLRVLQHTPALLEDRFRRELSRLEEWEQTQTLATLQRIAAMMEAHDIPADPILATESLSAEQTDEGRNAADPDHPRKVIPQGTDKKV